MFTLPGWFLRLFAGLLLGGVVVSLALVALPESWRQPYVPFLVGALCLAIAFTVGRRHPGDHTKGK